MCSTGSAVDAIGSGSFSKYGIRKNLLAANIFIFVGLGICLIHNEIAIIIGRFLYGIAPGIYAVY